MDCGEGASVGLRGLWVMRGRAESMLCVSFVGRGSRAWASAWLIRNVSRGSPFAPFVGDKRKFSLGFMAPVLDI